MQKLGGPGVNPYQPPGIWEEATFGKIEYRQSKGESLYRRSVYTFWRRIVGPTTGYLSGSLMSALSGAARPTLLKSILAVC